MDTEKLLDISWKTILKISFTIVCFYIIFSIRDIIIWFVFALIISVLFNPAIDFLQKNRIPRVFGAISVYLGIFGLFTVLIYLIIPLFISEIHGFLKIFPQYFEMASPFLKDLGFHTFENIESFLEAFSGSLEVMAGNIFNVLFIIFGGVFTTLFVIFTALFLSLEERAVEKGLMILFPKKYETQVLNIWSRCQKKVSSWFGARLIACLFVGLASYVAFLIFKVEYSFTLALFSGILNFIPYVGPLLTGVILFLIIFPGAALKGIFVLIAFTLIQQIENSILSPILMKKFVGLPPALVLISLVVGAKLWGLLGAILVVPLFGILFEFLKEFLQKQKEKESSLHER
ncbi:MAG: AI-2E family transporter [Candidatus Nealsonbacteria bacterium]|nr:AI-2E family transporter [Candidatus Nealsonbacteria bacterium]